jgi:hypothetical protein
MSKADEVVARAQNAVAIIAARKIRATMSVQLAVLDAYDCGLTRADFLETAATAWDQIEAARGKIEAKIAQAAESAQDELSERIEGAGASAGLKLVAGPPPAAEGAVRVTFDGALPVVSWGKDESALSVGVLCERLANEDGWRVQRLTSGPAGAFVTTDVFEAVPTSALRPENPAASEVLVLVAAPTP